MIELIMPKLGPSIERGTVVRWHKVRGEDIGRGQPIVDIETDKTVQEIEAEADGVLHEILVAEGQTCLVGAVLARMRAPGEAAEPVSVQTALPTASAIVEAQPSGDPVPVAVDDDIERLLIKASPAARRVARENGVDLSVVTGTGPRGRIVTDDVLRAVAVVDVLAQAAKPSIAPAPEAPAPVWAASAAVAVAGCGVRERRPLGSVRRVIGERMLHSQQSAPHFSVAMDVDMGRVKEARDAWASFGEDTVPSYNDFVLWACAQALRAMPELNASADGGDVVVYSDINVGMAVAAPDGLIVPVIRSAERMSVRGVAARSRDMAKRAHDRKLLPADCEGGTFTVSNLGMFGVDRFVAIINPPQAAILAVGRVAPRVVTDGRSISIRTEATLTLSVDHRIADGIVASRFLGLVKQALETFLPN